MYAKKDAMKKKHASTSARPTTPVTASGRKHNNKYSVKGTLLKQIHLANICKQLANFDNPGCLAVFSKIKEAVLEWSVSSHG